MRGGHCETARRRVRRGEDGGPGPSQFALVILLAVTDEAAAECFCDVRLSLPVRVRTAG